MAEPIGRDCLLFSTADWAAPYWTNKQHTARLLAGRGWRVLYVESPGLRMPRPGSSRDWSRLARRLASGLAGLFGHIPSPEPNIFVYSPLVVPGLALPRWLRAFNRWSLATPLRRFVRARRFDIPVVWTYHPFIFDALAGLSTGPLIYHCVDDLAAVPFVDAPAIETFERTLLERADAVFATSKPLAEKCRSLNPNTHFLPNVADARHFGGAFEPGPLPADLATIPAPRLGYHGVLSDYKLDFPLLLELFSARPDWHLVLIGEEREGQSNPDLARLGALPNVYRLGYRPYADLPAYLRGIQVGLLPSALNAYTRAMFPMKFYEFLAAGIPVAATPLAFAAEPHPGLAVGAGPAGFAAAIARQLARGRLTRQETLVAVGENTWGKRLDRMLALAGLESAGRDEAAS